MTDTIFVIIISAYELPWDEHLSDTVQAAFTNPEDTAERVQLIVNGDPENIVHVTTFPIRHDVTVHRGKQFITHPSGMTESRPYSQAELLKVLQEIAS